MRWPRFSPRKRGRGRGCVVVAAHGPEQAGQIGRINQGPGDDRKLLGGKRAAPDIPSRGADLGPRAFESLRVWQFFIRDRCS